MSFQSPEILAQWQCDPMLWRDFVEYDSSVYTKSIRSAKHFIIGTVIAAVLLTILLAAIPYFAWGKYGLEAWGPSFAVLIVAEIPILIGVLMMKLRQQKLAALKASSGSVLIWSNKLKVGDVDFNWHYNKDDYGWRFVEGARTTISPHPATKFEILELKFEAYIPGKNTPHREDATWRVPVPAGKEFEADAVLEKLKSIALTNTE